MGMVARPLNCIMGVVVGFEMHANGKEVRSVMVKFNNPGLKFVTS